MLHAIHGYSTFMDNATPFMGGRVFYGCSWVFFGALYPSHGIISTGDVGRSMDGVFQIMMKDEIQ